MTLPPTPPGARSPNRSCRPNRLMKRLGSRIRCRALVLRVLLVVAVVVIAHCFTSTPKAADPSSTAVSAGSFDTVVKPFLTQHCLRCHGPMKQNGSVAFHIRDGQSLQKDRDLWETVMQRLQQGEMPP